MPYAHKNDIITRYGQDALLVLADDDGDGNVDDNKVKAAIQDASEFIDTYLSSKYTIPLASPPSLVKRLCVDIAFYMLGTDMLGGSDEREKRYKDAIAFLKDISAGRAGLGLPADKQPEPEGGPAEITSSPRLFSRSTLSEF